MSAGLVSSISLQPAVGAPVLELGRHQIESGLDRWPLHRSLSDVPLEINQIPILLVDFQPRLKLLSLPPESKHELFQKGDEYIELPFVFVEGSVPRNQNGGHGNGTISDDALVVPECFSQCIQGSTDVCNPFKLLGLYNSMILEESLKIEMPCAREVVRFIFRKHLRQHLGDDLFLRVPSRGDLHQL